MSRKRTVASVIVSAALFAAMFSVTAQRAYASQVPILSSGEKYGIPLSSLSHKADEVVLAKQARSATLMDAATGKILYAKDEHERLPMASITKIMTLLLIMEAIDDGHLKLTDKIKASEYASSMGGSQIFLEPGETMTVDEMLKGISIASANDACVAMAEHLSGTEENFVKKMNERATELGMRDTHFSNCNGLPTENHYSSAADIAIMSRELLKHPSVTKWTSVYSDYLRKNSDHPLWLVNTNKLVRFYEGVDGLKTGFTAEAKYCLSATAKRNEFRVIAVVMGEPRAPVRNAEVSQMLNYAFANYSSKIIYQKGDPVAMLKVSKGVKQTVVAVAGDTVGMMIRKGEEPDYDKKIELFTVKAPVSFHQRVGTLRVYHDDECIAKVPLLAKDAIKRAGFFFTLSRTFQNVVTFGHAKS